MCRAGGSCARPSDCDDSTADCTTNCEDLDGDGLAGCAGDCDDSAATGASCTSACSTFYRDADGDGFGLSSEAIVACEAPNGFVTDDLDCADSSPSDPECGLLDGSACNPGMAEGPPGDASCRDGADNDCDGVADSLDEDCWSAPGCLRRIQLTFDNSDQDEALIDVPVLVTLNSSRIDYGEARPDGQDIRFVDSDGTSIPHELEEWNPPDVSTFWVLVPNIPANSSTDHIYLYYGCPDISTTSPTMVWDPHYDGVWHLTGLNDSTSGAHDGVPMRARSEVGQAARGRRTLGMSDSRIDVMPSPELQQANLVSLWAYYETLGPTFGDNALVTGGASSLADPARNYQYALSIRPDFSLQLYWEFGDGMPYTAMNSEPVGTFNPQEWHHIAFLRDETAQQVTFFFDGRPVGPPIDYPDNPTGGMDTTLWFGASQFAGGLLNFDGRLDEIRITQELLTANWIWVQYLSMTDAFISYGPAEP